MHKTAQKFIGTFFTQMVEQMFAQVNESSESGFETEMYSGFLSEAMAEKIAQSNAANDMVLRVENKLRRQAGLDEIKNNTFTPIQFSKTNNLKEDRYMAQKTYEFMKKNITNQEKRHVCTTAA